MFSLKKCTALIISAVILCVLSVSAAAGSVSISSTYFPDSVFRSYVSTTYDTDKNGILSDSEIAKITSISVAGKSITSLKGIEYFTALTYLSCYNNQLTALDVSKNTALTYLSCYRNKLTALDVSKNIKLYHLDFDGNQLTTVDVSKNTALTLLDCRNNKLTALNISKNTLLKTLYCYGNQLTTLDVSKNTALTTLSCYNNQLTALDISNNTKLTTFYAYSQAPKTLHASKQSDGTYQVNLGDYVPAVSKISSVTGSPSPTYSTSTGIAKFSSRPSSISYKYDTAYVNSSSSYRYMTVTLTADSKPYILTSGALTEASIYKAYSFDLEASGVTPVTWSVISNSLPNGLSLNSSTGRISGTPTKSGLFTFRVKALNSYGNDSRDISINVKSSGTAPAITSYSPLTAGTIGKSYSYYLSASGTTPITWAVVSGKLPAGLTLNASTGRISGTPSEYGTFSFTLRASNNYGSNDKSFSLTIKAVAPEITTSSPLPEGIINNSYSLTLSASGTAPITWTRTSGNLPSGLTLSTSGVISGTPAATGTFSFTVRASNSAGSISRTYTLNIKGIPPEISTASELHDCTATKPYDPVTLEASGTPQITWTLTGGTLPAGLTLGNTGTISGTPSKTGTFSFTLRAENAWGSDTRTFKIKILPKLTVYYDFINGVKGVSYSDYSEVRGGTVPYTWNLESGALPPGLNLSTKTSGRYAYLTGKPTKEGTFAFTLRTSDKNGAAETKDFSMTIEAPMTFKGTFPEGSVKVPYSSSITVTGGIAPYKWQKVSGEIPAGLKLKFSGNTATLSGKPTKAGTFKFYLNVYDEDEHETGIKLFSVTITPALTIKDSFSGGRAGVSYSDYVYAEGGKKSYTWTQTSSKINFLSGTLPPGLKLSYSGAKANLKGKPTKGGTYTFTLEVTDKNGTSYTKTYTVIIMYIDGSFTTPAYIGKSYSSSVSIKGGTKPYTWSKISGSFPTGLTFKAEGDTAVLSGTPSKAGKFAFTLKAADKTKTAVTKSFTIQVVNPPSISGSFVNGMVGKNYSDYVEVKNGVSPYTWSIVKGRIPDGLKPASYSGAKFKLTGKPSKAGKYTFTVRVTDKNGITSEKQFAITTAAKLKISGEYSDGSKGIEYEDHINASGGTSPYTWTKASGKIPDGLELSYSGTEAKLTGTPKKSGKFNFTIKVTDKNGFTESKAVTLTIFDLNIKYSFSNGKTGSNYSDYIEVQGGTVPYKWSVVDGSLPPGLSESTKTQGRYYYLKGKPTQAGTFTFTLEAADKNGASGMQEFTIKITGTNKSELPSKRNTIPEEVSSYSENSVSSLSEEAASQPVNYDLPVSMLSDGTTDITDTGSNVSGSEVTLKVISDDILEAGSGRDEDLITVRASQPLRFIIGTEITDAVVLIDDKAVEIEVSDERIFILPAEIVHDDFKVKAKSENTGLETEELYISAE